MNGSINARTRSTWITGLVALCLVTVPGWAQQARPPQARPPQAKPPQAKPPQARPPHNHDRSNLPPGRVETGPRRGQITREALEGLSSRADAVAGRLRQGSLVVASGRPLPAATQKLLFGVLTDAPARHRGRLTRALTSRGNEAARAEARAVEASLRGLLNTPERVNASVAAYNRLVAASSVAFLTSPPQEFVAVHTVLAALVQAGGSSGGASR